MRTFDDILQDVGQFGPYQKRLYLSVCLIGTLTSAAIVLNTFLFAVPNHRCKIPGYDNDTYVIQGQDHEALVKAYIPADSSGIYLHDRCNVFAKFYIDSTLPLLNATWTTLECQEWVFDTSVFDWTLTTELDMVCNRAIRIPTAQSIMFAGVLTGSLVFGQVSDLIGRRKTQFLGIGLLIISLGSLIAMQEYIGICVVLFCLGAAILGLYMTSYVLAMEFVGSSKRRITGTIIQLFNVIGGLYCLLMAYLFRSWRYFTAGLAGPALLLAAYYWVTPESCRWLLTKQRKEEAIGIMKQIAKVNRKTFNETDLDDIKPPEKEGRVWLLFSTKALTIRTVILFYNWFVCSMAFYGFIWNVGNLGGDFFLNFALMMIIEFPVHIGSYFALQKVGRRTLHMSYMLVGAAFCMATLWPIINGSDDLHVVLVTLALIGQCCVGGAFLTVYLLSSELYPTVVRNGGMGASSAVARIGSMLSPYIVKSADLIGGTTGRAVPLTVFGVAMFLAGVSSWFLPETNNRPLSDTIEEASSFSRNAQTSNGELKSSQSKQSVDNMFTNVACDYQ